MPIVPASPDALHIGARVVVRYRLEPAETAATPGRPTMTDAVGDLVRRDDDVLVVETRRGRVSVRCDWVVAVKEVPPAPARRAPAHLALSVPDMARVSAPSWGAVERETLGAWELRASHGFTQRGSSALVLGDPGLPLPAALDAVERWYAVRGLPPRVALPGSTGFDPGSDPVGAALLARGWTAGGRSHHLTAATATIATADPWSPDGPRVDVTEELLDPWLEAYRRSRTVVESAVPAVLGGSPRQLFGSIAADDAPPQHPPVAIARLAVAHGWAGLGAVWTDPDHRGRGLARRLTARLAAVAAADGIRLVHLQVEADNAPALRLYEGIGFERHSEYVYLTGPTRS
ncbi:acetyltransferase [Knoellia aerolata DSM 18566]|uniref:Acetyltransferase n=1 Tax=Knoellia aerolata DSM 18566 TaxID=1385519 RepID=A0A0A0K275_9MICO|nr:acetyltransferase [Knoellia aerolata DSM 18566]